ncbi:hypothetical protein D1007_59440 [Hordeum vulgare]|nr:hypothetical protein D1007_59440 [Hordeum vulgare]
MDTPVLALVTVEVEVAKSMAGGAPVDLPVGHLRATLEASSNVVPRKRLGNIIVPGGTPVPAATIAATKGAGRPKSRPLARYREADNIGETEAAEAAKKKVVLKRKRAPSANKAPASYMPSTAVVPPVFDEMPERSEYVAILEENAVNIEMHRLGTMDTTTWMAGYTMAAKKKRRRRSCTRLEGRSSRHRNPLHGIARGRRADPGLGGRVTRCHPRHRPNQEEVLTNDRR